MIYLLLIAPGLLVAYALYLRPFLHALPMFKDYYDTADGFWAKVWVLFGKSTTIAFSAGLQLLSQALQWIDPIATLVGDPDLRQQITDSLQANPIILGRILMAISFITVAARLRGFVKQADE